MKVALNYGKMSLRAVAIATVTVVTMVFVEKPIMNQVAKKFPIRFEVFTGVTMKKCRLLGSYAV
jgi:hypothetical protein